MPDPYCPHIELKPRWNNPDDTGELELVSHYECEKCGKRFSPLEASVIFAGHEESDKYKDD